MSDFWWAVAIVVSQIMAVLVWLASTFGLAVAILFWCGKFEWRGHVPKPHGHS